jgi:hypothetical protein
MPKITLRECTLAFLEKTFELQQIQKSEELNSWLSSNYDLSDFEKQYLLSLQNKLLLNVIHWNEQELLSNFIVPIFTLVNFTTKKFNDFSERNIKATIGEYELSGNPDGIIATGLREPEIPYFAFQEYKPYTDPTGEPPGQCLAAMLVGQTLNKNSQIIYGCYVIGKEWNFMLLRDKEYVISKAFVVDDDEIFDVFRIVQGLKQILLKILY